MPEFRRRRLAARSEPGAAGPAALRAPRIPPGDRRRSRRPVPAWAAEVIGTSGYDFEGHERRGRADLDALEAWDRAPVVERYSPKLPESMVDHSATEIIGGVIARRSRRRPRSSSRTAAMRQPSPRLGGRGPGHRRRRRPAGVAVGAIPEHVAALLRPSWRSRIWRSKRPSRIRDLALRASSWTRGQQPSGSRTVPRRRPPIRRACCRASGPSVAPPQLVQRAERRWIYHSVRYALSRDPTRRPRLLARPREGLRRQGDGPSRRGDRGRLGRRPDEGRSGRGRMARTRFTRTSKRSWREPTSTASSSPRGRALTSR